ncbi:MAG: hypothetical protein WBD22_06325 [Pyrinomonadaceae bacterium]
MVDSPSTSSRSLVDTFGRHFDFLLERTEELVRKIEQDDLFVRPRDLPRTFTMFSCGEYILRSAAVVEQSFGGIMTRLWDDPFEWTLPEKLSTNQLVLEYLDEVRRTARKGICVVSSDDDLKRQVPSPERLRTLFEILLDTLSRADHFQGRAFAVFQMLSDQKLPKR